MLSPSPVVCQSSQPSSLHEQSYRRLLFTKFPKDGYDHHERILALSSSPCVSSSHCRPRRQQHRSPQHRHLLPSSPSCHRSQSSSLSVLLPNGSDRGDDSGCGASRSSPSSFLSFVIMVIATILLPVTTSSFRFASFICSLACDVSSFRLPHSRFRPLSSQSHSSQSRHTPQSSPSNKSYSYCPSLQSHFILTP